MFLRMNGYDESGRSATRYGKLEMRQFHGSQYVERTVGQQTNAWKTASTGSAAGTSANTIPIASARKEAEGIRNREPVFRYAGRPKTTAASSNRRPNLKRNASRAKANRRNTGPN